MSAPTVAAQQCGPDEKALEAAIVAVESMGCVHFGAEIEAAIRAYLEAATLPDVAGMVEAYAADYDYRADNGSGYTPTDGERAMLVDFGHGLLRQAATALRLSAGGGVPEGWKLVPVDPTPEMLGAFWRQKNCGTQEVGERGPHTDDCSAYRAMLAASPTVEAGHVE